MAKYKVTKKSMKESYDNIARVGYCNLQYLLYYTSPFAYSTRAEGWACDYYDLDGILISTGYAPLESKRTKCNYDICRKYDMTAEKIIGDYSISIEERKEKVEKLIKDFVSEICK